MDPVRIVLIEDEPSALRYLSSIVEKKISGFRIAATALNGAEGLAVVASLRPDVVITDIKMPVMDGLKLAARLRVEFPFVYCVIVSGYQDFQYARGAMQSGVVDYLLKPVNAAQLTTVLESIRGRLSNDYYLARVDTLKRTLAGSPVEPWKEEKYLPYKRFEAAVARTGGLRSRYSVSSAHADAHPTHHGMESFADGRVWIFPGRDDQERIYLSSPDLFGSAAFHRDVASETERTEGDFSTIVFSGCSFTLSELRPTISLMYRTLDNTIVLGVTQIKNNVQDAHTRDDAPVVLDPTLGSRIEFLLANSLFAELETEVRRLCGDWEKGRRPQLWVESTLHQVMLLMVRKSANVWEGKSEELEFRFDEAVRRADTFSELTENAWSLFKTIARCPDSRAHKTDAPALLDAVEKYVAANYSDPISLQSVCGTFGISQTYLSRLFRKYEDTSFHDYLTAVRMETAKKLMRENPLMPLKDVAAFVGYKDQFYFSRLFKSITGVPPSEFGRDATEIPP